MRHRTAARHGIYLVCDRAGRRSATADISGSSAENGRVRALCAARTEFADGTSLGGASQACRFGRDERLMIDHHQDIGLNKLRLDHRGANRHQRLAGENHRSLGNGPDIAREAEGTKTLEKFLGKATLFPQKRNILVVKMQILNIFDDLLKSRSNGKAAVIGVLAIEDVKINDLVSHAANRIAISHGQLIVVAKHR